MPIGTHQVAQKIKALVALFDDLGSVPAYHMIKGEN